MDNSLLIRVLVRSVRGCAPISARNLTSSVHLTRPYRILRAHDFAGRFTFTGALAAFLLATFIVYFVACQASPEIIKTIGRFYGMNVSYDLENYGGSIPVYIAAAFMGVFTQSASCLLSFCRQARERIPCADGYSEDRHGQLGQLHNSDPRACLHQERAWKGGPGPDWRCVVEEARRLTQTLDFYRQQLKRMNLDDESEVRELLRGSQARVQERPWTARDMLPLFDGS